MTPLETIADRVAACGWCVAEQFAPPDLTAALAAEARTRLAQGAFHTAGTGAGARLAVRPAVRGDRVCWLDAESASPAQQDCLARFEALRLALNRELQLGLFDFECHFAAYAPGARYARHRDRFKDDSRRALSCVLYLNEQWREADAGQLRLYLDQDESMDITPYGGRLIAFLSERFEHEVLPAARERLSLTGWFRRRG